MSILLESNTNQFEPYKQVIQSKYKIKYVGLIFLSLPVLYKLSFQNN